jgi:NADH-quinone oxidoreductase subunit M
MSAIGLILVLIAGGLLAWLAGRRYPQAARWIALAALAVDLLWLLWLWWQGPLAPPAALDYGGGHGADLGGALGGPWLSEVSLPWITRFGIALHVGLDGLSLLFCLLAVLLGLMAVASSWREIRSRIGFFHLNILWTLAGTIGVFTALDLFLFFLFWELMLVPMALVIGLWGHDDSRRAAIKFFLFTQGSGLLLLVGVLILALGHAAAGGTLTFDAPALVGAAAGLDPRLAFWSMLGFFLAFAVKLPMVPLHSWLPDAHSLAPTGGSVLLAGILLKTGGYALIRFLLPLFPDALAQLTPAALALGVVGVVYGALLAFAQTDIKRLIACSSISQMGFVLIGVFAAAGSAGSAALDGAVLLMAAHAVTAAALFMIAGDLRERLHTLNSAEMGGLWGPLPRLSALGLVFAVATLGLPGFGNFAGEILVLIGTFRAYPVTALVALLGLITSAIYALAFVQRAFHGRAADTSRAAAVDQTEPRDSGPQHPVLHDLGPREMVALAVLVLAALGLGLYPQPLLDLTALPLAALAAPGVAS